MSKRVDLYDATYGNFANKVLQEVRKDAFVDDIGQNSWMTTDEFMGLLKHLGLESTSNVLEIGCGSGGPALFMARNFGLHVTGIDINEKAIVTANNMARAQRLDTRVRFSQGDAGKALPFESMTFDAITCIDSINHLPDRLGFLKESNRVLKPDGRLLFTDPTAVTGLISNEEIAIRSSIGFYVFTPPGEDERLITMSGFELLAREDVTENMALVSKRRRDSREKHSRELVKIEGEDTFNGTQRFLSMVHTLANEKRLSRLAFVCEKMGPNSSSKFAMTPSYGLVTANELGSPQCGQPDALN
jgi:SAM-dependent methyltransferase